MTEPTPAEYADFLTAVAEHLRAHPDLSVPWLRPGTVQVTRSEDASGLIAWLHSVGVVDLQISLSDDYAYVHVLKVPVGGVIVDELWGTVDGLQRHLIQGGYGRLHLTLADLEYFAEHGTLPEAGAR